MKKLTLTIKQASQFKTLGDAIDYAEEKGYLSVEWWGPDNEIVRYSVA